MTQTLAKRLGFTALLIYGIGDILGAGIYALVGKVVEIAGSGAWMTFVVAAVAALLTGLSYAELSSRFPVAAGAAAYVKRAFPGKLMPTVVGILVLGTGLISAATVTTAFSTYLNQLVSVNPLIAQIGLVLALSFLSFWGIQESSNVNIVFSIVEVLGLIAVIIAGFILGSLDSMKDFLGGSIQDFNPHLILDGITIAFFAYIGFEDLCNLAEESKNPSKHLPRAILIALTVATIIYLLVTLALVVNISQEEIIQSPTPLLLVFERLGLGWFLNYFSLIAMLAITNTGLVNLIMASRLLYGMSSEGLVHSSLSLVHASRRTPWIAVTLAGTLVLLLVLTGSLKTLAQSTSLLILIVFFFVHLSLLRVKHKKEVHTGFRIFPVFPLVGGLVCLFLISRFPLEAFTRTLFFILIGVAVWGINRWKSH